MTSKLIVGNLSDGTNSISLDNYISGMAKIMIQYSTYYSPYQSGIEKSHGISTVIDVATGRQEFTPSVSLGTVVNSRPLLAGVSTDFTADSFGYNGCLFNSSGRYSFSYYSGGWASASYISIMGI